MWKSCHYESISSCAFRFILTNHCPGKSKHINLWLCQIPIIRKTIIRFTELMLIVFRAYHCKDKHDTKCHITFKDYIYEYDIDCQITCKDYILEG